jgi:hypothetical protein
MLSDLHRLFCELWHRGQYVRPAIVGGYRCSACGAGFRDLVEAGAYEAMWVTLPRPGIVPAEPAAFEASAWRVVRNGRTWRVGRYRHGEPVELAS